MIFFLQESHSQNLSGPQLLDNAIAYHDPNNAWPTFNSSFTVVSQTPEKSDRTSEVMINLPEESFRAVAIRGIETISYIISESSCVITKADSLRIASLDSKPKRTHCETTELYQNYYTYLYGLPMKLKDPGTIIAKPVEKKLFKGKEYLILKATYAEGIGSDIWYFYFDPETYAMEIYQFFRQDEDGNQMNGTGEYILLTEESEISGIKMPKTRAWYYNKEDKYLGTDILK